MHPVPSQANIPKVNESWGMGWIVEIYLAEGIFDPQSKTAINK